MDAATATRTESAPNGTGLRTVSRMRGRMSREDRLRTIWKPLVFAAGLLPLVWLVWMFFSSGLGANPIEYINRYLGDWAMRFLLLALAVTPAVKLTGQATPMRFRRMIGLFAFFYAVLHVASYVGLDQFFDWAAIWKDLVKRTYITLGMGAFVILAALAITSPKAILKKMGAKNWRALHRLVYVAGVLVIAHYYMMVKADVREPLAYGAILAVLLGYRAWARIRTASTRG